MISRSRIVKLIGSLFLLLALPAFLLLLTPMQAFARDIYVATNGSDSNVGTIDQPLQSLQGARDKIRSLGIAGTEPINVYLRGGTYELASPVMFEPQDSGSSGYPVSYQGYNSETVELSGGRSLSAWQEIGGRWQTTIPEGLPIPRQLFINGNRATRARTTINGWTKNDTGYQTASPLQIAHPEDIEIVSQIFWY